MNGDEETPKPGEETPQVAPVGVEVLYASEDVQEDEMLGLTVKYKEINGSEFSELSAKHMSTEGNLDMDTYAQELFDTYVLEPKGINAGRMKPMLRARLQARIEGTRGMSISDIKN